MLLKVVGVRFKQAGKIYYFDPGDIELKTEDEVVVETARGIEYGLVVVGPVDISEEEVVAPLKNVLRKVTPEDRKQMEVNSEKEARAFQVGVEKINSHGLPMKLVEVEQTFDGNKIIFYFTADGRIDFRELVKDLAAVFRTRIELRQIGVRDEAKMMGGLGCCGRELCCSTWLSDFASVSIRMAKDQNLSLNPTKISGVCGRLMCCLKYENDTYELARSEFPEVGSVVSGAQGDGRVMDINIFKKTVTVELNETRVLVEYPVEEIMPKGVKKGDDIPAGTDDQIDGSKNSGCHCGPCQVQEICSPSGGGECSSKE